MQPSSLREIEEVRRSGKPWLQTLCVADEASLVDRERLELALEKIRARVKNPNHGLFGPGSLIWRVYGDQSAAFGGGCSVLLQTAHPFIAHSVQQKSAYRTDPQGRTQRTFRAIDDWVFRDVEHAFATARLIHRVHTRVVGSIANRVGPYDAGDTYAATEQHSQFWVHATGVDVSLTLYEAVHGRLSRDERERYNEESKLFALLFGIDEAIIPPTFGDFQEYMQRMFASDVLTPDQASLDIAKYVLSAPTKKAASAFALLRLITAGLLPPRLRHGYQFRWGRVEQAAFDAAIAGFRVGIPRLPDALRYSAFHRRALHAAENTEPGLLERRVNRALAGMSKSAARAPESARL